MKIPQWRLFRSEQSLIVLAVIGLLGLCSLALFNELGTLGLMDKTEGLFVEIPRQMLLSGDWVTPRWNGETFFDYPVWGYWMVAISFRVFGITEWAARLPSAMAATLTVLALFGMVFHFGSQNEPFQRRLGRATLAGSLLALSPGWIAWGRSSVTDMFLASAITWALLGFLLVYQAGVSDRPRSLSRQQHLGYFFLSLFSGIAVLAKGPVGVVLPALVIISFVLLTGTLVAHVRQAPWLLMVALFLGVTMPWYGAATLANGFDFLSRFIGYSNFQRFTAVIYSHPGPPWFYIPWVFVFLLPWSLYLPVAVIRHRFWRLSTWRATTSQQALSLFALVWLVSIVVFYSVAATKLAGYILPIVPAGVLLVSLLFQPFTSAPSLGQGVRVSGWINAVLLGGAASASMILTRLLKQEPDYPFFAQALAHSGLQVWLPILLGIAALWLVTILLSDHGLSAIWLPNVWALSVVLAVVLPIALPLVDRERLLPIRTLGSAAARLMQPNDVLAVVGFKRYSLLYYADRPVVFVTSPEQVFEALENRKSVGNVFLFGTEREIRRFGLPLSSSHAPSSSCEVVARSGSHLLIRSNPSVLCQAP